MIKRNCFTCHAVRCTETGSGYVSIFNPFAGTFSRTSWYLRSALSVHLHQSIDKRSSLEIISTFLSLLVSTDLFTLPEAVSNNPEYRQVLLRVENSSSITTDRKLGLHVGDDGVIGRTISLEVEGHVAGEGLVRWL